MILLIRSLQRTTSKRKPATKNIGGKRQLPRSFFPGIEFDTAKATNRQSGNLARIVLNISLRKISSKTKLEKNLHHTFFNGLISHQS